MGIPYRIVISSKTVQSSVCEVKQRRAGQAELLNQQQLDELLGIHS
jgi:hypothetical protein